MKSARRYILFVTMATFLVACINNYSSNPVCRVENGRIIFKLDKTWSEQEKKEIMLKYDIDSSLFVKAFSGKGEILIDSVLWKFRSVNPFFAELSKPLDKQSGDFLQKNEVLIINDSWVRKPFFVDKTPVISGINKFRKESVFRYQDGVAQFYLPGHKDAVNVYLSGTFNDWSTMKTSMVAYDSGWIVKVQLKPGKYTYKLVVDRKWILDPANDLYEPNEYGTDNSVLWIEK